MVVWAMAVLVVAKWARAAAKAIVAKASVSRASVAKAAVATEVGPLAAAAAVSAVEVWEAEARASATREEAARGPTRSLRCLHHCRCFLRRRRDSPAALEAAMRAAAL